MEQTKIQIFVKDIEENLMALMVDPDTTIAQVRSRVAQKVHADQSANVFLFHRGKRLQASKSVADSGIKNGHTVVMNLKFPGGLSFKNFCACNSLTKS